ncbi:protein kinase C-like [Physella acuta]|uniref:protein kinase C-like n=1 Tax=Physella acuta TaxID=109671 RepID=UPI0027DC01B7|nr:protein kinase C-like [Physella acuta]
MSRAPRVNKIKHGQPLAERYPVLAQIDCFCFKCGKLMPDKLEAPSSILELEELIHAQHKVPADSQVKTQKTASMKNYFLDKKNPRNLTFPWLTNEYIRNTRNLSLQRRQTSMHLNTVNDLYILLDIFSTSKNSLIYYAKNKKNDDLCAIRLYHCNGVEQEKLAHKEAKILELARECPFVVNVQECFKTLSGHYLVMESFGLTTLHNLIKNKFHLIDEELRIYAAQLVTALIFLHGCGVTLRNLTASTIGVLTDGNLKIFDLEEAYLNNGQDLFENYGLQAYHPPEFITSLRYSSEADWWSLGVILYLLMHGKMPFVGPNRRQLYWNIVYTKPHFPPLHAETSVSLVTMLLEKNPAARLSGATIRHHQFFSQIDWVKVGERTYDPPFRIPEHALCRMPAKLCNPLDCTREGLEVLDLDVAIAAKKKLTRKSLTPMCFDDYELSTDWTVYIKHHGKMDEVFAYMNNHLEPPRYPMTEGKLYVEDCILKLQDLTISRSTDAPELTQVQFSQASTADLLTSNYVPGRKGTLGDRYMSITRFRDLATMDTGELDDE